MRSTTRSALQVALFVTMIGRLVSAQASFDGETIADIGDDGIIKVITYDEMKRKLSTYTYTVPQELKSKVQDAEVVVRPNILTDIVVVTVGGKEVLWVPDQDFERSSAAVWMSPKATVQMVRIRVSNDADALDVACDGKTAVVVGANSNTPVSLVDLDRQTELSTVAYPGKLARAVAVDNDGKQALVVIDDTGLSVAGAIRRVAISNGAIIDTGEQLTFGGMDYIWRLALAPNAKFGAAVVGPGPTRVVIFTVPGLGATGSISFSNTVSAVVFGPAGDRVYVRRGNRGLTDRIEAFPFDPATGAIGQAPVWTTTPVSGFTGTGFQTPMAITADGTTLVVADEDLAGTPPAPRVARLDAASGAVVGSDITDAKGSPKIVSTPRACKSASVEQTAVEFYHEVFDHYFVTWVAAEIDNLDSGRTAGWVRTGQSFKVFTTPPVGTAAVCRIYIPPGKGDGHFFGRDANECAGTMSKNPTFVLESPAFFHLFPPSAGNCAAGTVPVYRVFSNRADANHRYTTSRATRDLMVTRGWIAEGDGADAVVMCAPS